MNNLSSKFNSSFNNLAIVLMILSFIGMSFLLIHTTLAIISEFISEEKSFGGMFILALIFILEIALSAVFVDIHRRGVSVLVGFKNFWHFLTILGILTITFYTEKVSISNGLSYIQENVLKDKYSEEIKSDKVLEYEANILKAENKIKEYEKFEGSKSDKLKLKLLNEKYQAAVKDKAYRLKNYKNATTIKADKIISNVLDDMEILETKIRDIKSKNISIYEKVKSINEQKILEYTSRAKSNRDMDLLNYSNKADKWAHHVVLYMAFIYFIHGVLMITSEDDFKLEVWLKRLLPFFDNKITATKNEVEKMTGNQTEEVKEEIDFDVKYTLEEVRAQALLAKSFDHGERVTKQSLASLIGKGDTTAYRMMKKFTTTGVLIFKDGSYFYNENVG